MTRSQEEPVLSDPRLAQATQAAIARWGLAATTLERIAAEAGISRATIYRRGVTRDQLVAALTQRAAETFRAAIWPALTATTVPAAGRLRAALEAVCAAADSHLPLLAGMYLAGGEAFHKPGPGALLTDVFAEPFERILADGAADGTLRAVPVELTATVLFNTIGWGYVHLRISHHWDPAIARSHIIDLVLHGLEAADHP